MLQAAAPDGDADTELGLVMVRRGMRLKMENIDSGQWSVVRTPVETGASDSWSCVPAMPSSRGRPYRVRVTLCFHAPQAEATHKLMN